MCVDCNGLGERLEVDPDLVVPDPTLSIRDGAIAAVGRRDREATGLDANIVDGAREGVRASISTSRGTSSTTKQREILLYGTGDKRVKVDLGTAGTATGEWAMRFEGILAQLKKRLQRDVVEAMRRSALRAVLPRASRARACNGTRLRPESRAVFVAEQGRSSTSPA